jgi:hypothetical protein
MEREELKCFLRLRAQREITSFSIAQFLRNCNGQRKEVLHKAKKYDIMKKRCDQPPFLSSRG